MHLSGDRLELHKSSSFTKVYLWSLALADSKILGKKGADNSIPSLNTLPERKVLDGLKSF